MALVARCLTQQLGRPVANGGRIRAALAEGEFDVINYHNVSLVGGPGLCWLTATRLKLYMAHEHWLVCPTTSLGAMDARCCGRQCMRCQLHYRRPPQLTGGAPATWSASSGMWTPFIADE